MTGTEHETLEILRVLLNGFLALGIVGVAALLVVVTIIWRKQMNQDQLFGILRIALAVVLPILTAKGYVPAGAVTDISSAVIAIGAAGWSWGAHTDSAKLAAVTALPDVRKIVTVASPVNDAVKAAMNDSSQPKVAPVL